MRAALLPCVLRVQLQEGRALRSWVATHAQAAAALATLCVAARCWHGWLQACALGLWAAWRRERARKHSALQAVLLLWLSQHRRRALRAQEE